MNGILKRGAPTVWPHELTLITDKSNPSYDGRIEDKVPLAAIMDAAANGIAQSVRIRALGEEGLAVVDGQQRTKRGLIINHLVGVHVLSDSALSALPAVNEAIEECKKTGADKRILELCPTGIKLPILVERGDVKDAIVLKVSLNEHRSGGSGDTVERKIEMAKRMEKLGASHEEIAAARNVDVATVKRWLTTDTTKTKAERKASKPGPARASIKKIEKIRDKVTGLSDRERAIFDLATGKMGADEFLQAFGVDDEAEESAEAAA